MKYGFVVTARILVQCAFLRQALHHEHEQETHGRGVDLKISLIQETVIEERSKHCAADN